ncbi:unnamed protein product, partial [Didymodactylos carnosus]
PVLPPTGVSRDADYPASVGRILWGGPTQYFDCTGTVIATENRNVVCTAAHCCYDSIKNTFYDKQNWIFAPQYKNGNSPYGKWTASKMYIGQAWVTNKGYYDADICLVVLSQLNNKRIADVVGAQGVGIDYPRGSVLISFGYPYDAGKGEEMSFCKGTAKAAKAYVGFLGQMVACTMDE